MCQHNLGSFIFIADSPKRGLMKHSGQREIHVRQKIALLILTLVILLGLGEVIARILVYRGTPAGVEFDEDINYTYRPFSHPNERGVNGLNDIGCIGDNVKIPKTANELRILLLGASTSFSQKYVTTIKS